MRVKNNLFLSINFKENILYIRKICFEEIIHFKSKILYAKYFKGKVIVIEEYRNKISVLDLDGFKIIKNLEYNIESKINNLKFFNLKKGKSLVVKIFYEDTKIKNFVINEDGTF